MALVPVSGTDIRLLSGVPFSNDYKNTRWFDNYSEQATYFLAKNRVHTMSKANFQRIEGKHFIAVDKSVDELWNTNYVMFRNTDYNSKWFFGFVTKIEYVQMGRTNVYFQIDVLQTWLFEMKFKPSYVIREHCRLWKSDGTPVINTVDEGLHYGSDYDVTSFTNLRPVGDVFYLVVVAKSTMHHVMGEGGTDGKPNVIQSSFNGIPQPLCYYVHPFKLDGTTPSVDTGSSINNVTDIQKYLSIIYSQENAVNNIVSMYVTEYFGYTAVPSELMDSLYFDSSKFEVVDIADGENETVRTIYVKELKEYGHYEVEVGPKANGFITSYESKLSMYPYQLTILTDFKGNQIELKNEYISGNDLTVRVRGGLGLSNKVAYTVPNYLSYNIAGSDNKLLIGLEHSLINNNPNDVPIITDMLSAYIQGNKNSLENQKNSIMWNGAMNAIGGGIGGMASAGGVNPIGLASAGASVVSGAGSTVLQLQGIQAKLQDINNVPPQLAKMGSNTAFDFGNDYTGVFVLKKQIKEEYRRKLEDFFNMFGYKLNEVKVPNFHTRKYWNYVQTSSCIITGNFNNEDLQELKNVFDNGITLWHTDDIGNYSLFNEVIA